MSVTQKVEQVLTQRRCRVFNPRVSYPAGSGFKYTPRKRLC